jgi:ribonuclease P protein component|tara:strand:- start:1470 stop:1838 length:369 start_codon:yes stop_codon:yes gene_type:complete
MKSEQDESGSKELEFILGKITKRSDYVKASRGRYIKTSSLFLQKVKRDDKKIPRYGVTASKKIGIAVERNRAKRRIRHAIKEVLPKYGKNGYDYVVVATTKTNKVSWKTVLNDLEKAFREIK